MTLQRLLSIVSFLVDLDFEGVLEELLLSQFRAGTPTPSVIPHRFLLEESN